MSIQPRSDIELAKDIQVYLKELFNLFEYQESYLYKDFPHIRLSKKYHIPRKMIGYIIKSYFTVKARRYYLKTKELPQVTELIWLVSEHRECRKKYSDKYYYKLDPGIISDRRKRVYQNQKSRKHNEEFIRRIEQSYEYVKRFCQKYAHGDYEELLHDTMEYALNNKDKYWMNAKMTTYLCSIAHNTNMRFKSSMSKDIEMDIAESNVINDNYDQQLLIARDIFYELNPKYQRIIELTIAGVRQKEIANELGTTMYAVKNILYKIRQRAQKIKGSV